MRAVDCGALSTVISRDLLHRVNHRRKADDHPGLTLRLPSATLHCKGGKDNRQQQAVHYCRSQSTAGRRWVDCNSFCLSAAIQQRALSVRQERLTSTRDP